MGGWNQTSPGRSSWPFRPPASCERLMPRFACGLTIGPNASSPTRLSTQPHESRFRKGGTPHGRHTSQNRSRGRFWVSGSTAQPLVSPAGLGCCRPDTAEFCGCRRGPGCLVGWKNSRQLGRRARRLRGGGEFIRRERELPLPCSQPPSDFESMESTRARPKRIQNCARHQSVAQSSVNATIYKQAFDRPMDEATDWSWARPRRMTCFLLKLPRPGSMRFTNCQLPTHGKWLYERPWC